MFIPVFSVTRSFRNQSMRFWCSNIYYQC